MNTWREDDGLAERMLINARLVLPDDVIEGSLILKDGRIDAIEAGSQPSADAVDCHGDYVIPGLIDLHTDNLEKHHQPRKGVFWDPVAAAINHDAQIIAAGVTTVFDSLTLGAAEGWDSRSELVPSMIDGLNTAHDQGLLRADHRLHLRCEVTHPDITAIVDRHINHPLVQMMSLMDHAPGDRQSRDIERYRRSYLPAFDHDEVALDRHIKYLMTKSRTLAPGNRRSLAAVATTKAFALASHDDASMAQICLLYTSPSPRDQRGSRMPSSA